MTMLCEDHLKQVLSIMQSMKQQIVNGNWTELNRLDNERRQVILGATQAGKSSILKGIGSYSQTNVNDFICCANYSQNLSEQQRNERSRIVENVRLLDNEIIEESLSARSAVIVTTRKFSSQQKVKNLYAESSAQIR